MRVSRRIIAGLAGAALVVLLGASPGHANLVTSTFIGSDATHSAQVTFGVDSGNSGVLHVTLANTYGGPENNADITNMVTALFFQITPSVALGLTSAQVSAGSSLIQSSGSSLLSTTSSPIDIQAPPDGTVQGGWQYQYTGSQQQGLGTVGLNIFQGNQVGNPEANFALATMNWVPSMGNGSIKYPVVSNSIDFTLAVLPAGFNVQTGISHVTFVYGTSSNELSLLGGPVPNPPPPVPEPATFFGASIAAAAAALYRVRTRRRIAA